jgi:hypothetical protein
VISLSIAQIDQDKTAIRWLISAEFGQLQRAFVEIETFFQIQHIEIVVGKTKFHWFFPQLHCLAGRKRVTIMR